MTNTELDSLIMSLALPYWQKVAMIISKVTRDEKFSFNDRDEEFNFVATGIARLVANGQLESQGDISSWRFSEIRLGNR
jgi:hypothetical protein